LRSRAFLKSVGGHTPWEFEPLSRHSEAPDSPHILHRGRIGGFSPAPFSGFDRRSPRLAATDHRRSCPSPARDGDLDRARAVSRRPLIASNRAEHCTTCGSHSDIKDYLIDARAALPGP